MDSLETAAERAYMDEARQFLNSGPTEASRKAGIQYHQARPKMAPLALDPYEGIGMDPQGHAKTLETVIKERVEAAVTILAAKRDGIGELEEVRAKLRKSNFTVLEFASIVCGDPEEVEILMDSEWPTIEQSIKYAECLLANCMYPPSVDSERTLTYISPPTSSKFHHASTRFRGKAERRHK